MDRMRCFELRDVGSIPAGGANYVEEIPMNINDNSDFQLVNARFPHIGEKIALLWGHKEFHNYMKHLMHDTREGTRKGFPHDIAKALFRLSNLHDNRFPMAKNNPRDIWSTNGRIR